MMKVEEREQYTKKIIILIRNNHYIRSTNILSEPYFGHFKKRLV